MEKRKHIAGKIEQNRIALLRMVFCWISAAMCLKVSSDRRLPRRVARWVNARIYTAEKAAGYLLIAVFYNCQIKKCASPAFEKAAIDMVAAHRVGAIGAITVSIVIARLKALQHILHNLHHIARHTAKNISARARIVAMKTIILAKAQVLTIPRPTLTLLLEDAAPP